MKWRIEPFELIVLGVGVAAILGVSVAQLNAAYPEAIYRYQGLIGALIALVAASTAYIAALRQIRNSREQEARRQNRRIAEHIAGFSGELTLCLSQFTSATMAYQQTQDGDPKLGYDLRV